MESLILGKPQKARMMDELLIFPVFLWWMLEMVMLEFLSSQISQHH